MEEIGQKLRAARIEKGYTLDDLQQITKIQKRYLIAIEEGNFDALPGDFYVRAFIKQYAETVGLDSEALLTQFQKDIPDPQPQEYVDQSLESKTRKAKETDNGPSARLKRYWPQIGIVLVALVVLVGVVYVTWKSSANDKPTIPNDASSVSVSSKKDTAKASSSAKQKKQASSASASSKKKAAASSSKKKAKSGLTVTVQPAAGNAQAVTLKNLPKSGNKVKLSATSASAWVSVNVNGATTWQGSLTPGSNHTVDLPDGTTSFSVKSGNAPTTGIELNGKKVDISKGTSVVRTITFSEGAAASSSSSSSESAGN